jgi:rhamnogalacturonan endolyase
MWIGLTPDDGLDPQAQFFTYQFWVKTASNGSFSIPHVIAGTYALWAFGRGAAGTFTTATGTIPNSSILTRFTAPAGSIIVTAGQTQNLGTVTITPPRTAATVWEIGVPDRDSHEFLNGAINYTNWATSYETYAANFGNGVTYTAGTDDYTKIWNYSDVDASPWTVNFTMATASTGQGRFYVALAANEGGTLSVSLNGTFRSGPSPRRIRAMRSPASAATATSGTGRSCSTPARSRPARIRSPSRAPAPASNGTTCASKPAACENLARGNQDRLTMRESL